jgi:serine/threonine protein kinase/class 3 adenylate cyclase
MTLDRYRLLAQLGAGKDGAAYRGWEPGPERPVVVCLLAAARADESRWRALCRRLRMAALLEHPAALAVYALDLESDSPHVVLEEPPADDLVAVLGREVPQPAAAVTALGRDLTGAVAAAHRLGLVHGRLTPRGVLLTRDRAPKIDFTRVEAYGPPPPSDPAVEVSCRAPELSVGPGPDAAADVYALAAVLFWLLRGRAFHPGAPPQPAAPLEDLLRRMLAADPVERPSAEQALRHLAGLLAPVGVTEERPAVAAADEPLGPHTIADPAAHTAAPAAPRERLGRFRLLESLGTGGLGQVFRAEDPADGTVVAIKVLRPEVVGRPHALQRFRKEARLLAEVRSPYVANLVEMNEDGGVHYLAQEFVPGTNLARLLDERGRLDEPFALAVAADVARALADAHRRGIIHRDVKPENVLLAYSRETPASAESSALAERSRLNSIVKLADFGLARHVVESESLHMTQDGATVGTALYMAPEQAAGEAIGPAADVYSLGATLFHLLAGRPPFQADTFLAVSRMHAEEPPPALGRLNPAVSAATCRLLEKALAKRPADRYPDADALLRDLERVLRGEPTDVAVHPRLPDCPPERVIRYDWTWDLDAPPERLWPYVSNTDRLNRAAGIPAVDFTAEPVAATEPGLRPRTRRHGQFRVAGFTNAWEEHPFEWVEGRRLGVLREYTQGVLKWFVSTTELKPRPGGGTTLTHSVLVEPRNWLGRVVAAVEINLKGRRRVERVYRHIDDFVSGRAGDVGCADPFEPPPPLPAAARQRLDGLLRQVVAAGVDAKVALRLGEFLERAAPQEAARIRPLVLARRLGLDADQVVTACLHGARLGLLVLLWDIICPVCRLPSSVKDTLRALGEHSHCPACNLDFALDFSRAVELIFRAHPEVRSTEVRTYCIGGPSHWPHVAAQVRARPGECVELSLSLREGTYRLAGPQLPRAFDFRVEPTAFLTRWDFRLKAPPGEPTEQPCLRSGGQLLTVTNDYAQELLVRVERTVLADDALTAARAASLALFRELFPAEVLSPGQLVSVATVTLLVTDLGSDESARLYEALGDAQAFGVLHAHHRRAEQSVRREGGALVKMMGEGVLAAFSEPAAAVRAGLDLLGGAGDAAPAARVAVHRGPALAATLNDHLDYFGTTASQAAQLPRLIAGGEMVLTQAVASDPQVAELLRDRGLAAEVLAARLPGRSAGLLHRLKAPDRQPD